MNQKDNQTRPQRPKVGLALSGASSRSVFYIGFLEVLQEHDFPIDVITALSGATIVAASFATGTMAQLKNLALRLNKDVVLSIIERSSRGGGLYKLSKAEQLFRVYTKNNNFEDVWPRLGFLTTDLKAGQSVTLQVGDLAKAICASCALPVVFEPQIWGSRQLVDGGIMCVVPGQEAKQMGADLIIGIDLRATRHVFSPWQISIRKFLNMVRGFFWPKHAQALWKKFLTTIRYSEVWQNYFYLGPHHEPELQNPALWSVMNRSLDLAINAQQSASEDKSYGCDLLITKELNLPWWKKIAFIRFTHIDNMEEYYQSGRRAAKEHLPEMWQMLKDWELNQSNQTEKIAELLKAYESSK